MAFKKAKSLQDAHKYAIQGKHALAIQQYLAVLEHDPSNLILLNTIGDLYIRDNHVAEGLKHFYRLADAYVKEGFIVRAIAIYKKISKIDQNSVEPALKLADLYQSQGLAREAREQLSGAFEFYKKTAQLEKILEVLRKLARLDPDNPNSHLRLAQYAEEAAEQKEAADAYLEAAQAAERQGDASTTEQALKKAVVLLPDDPEVQLSLARQAFHKRQPEQIEKILANYPQLQTDPRGQQLLFETYLAVHNLDAAEKMLPDVIRRSPLDASFFADFATQCLAEQNYNQAFRAASSVAQALIEKQVTGPLMEVLRKIWSAMPEKIDNLELICQICQKTNDEATLPDVLEALGHAYVQAGQFKKAEEAYAKLVAAEPANETYKDLLKQVLQKQGKEYTAADFASLVGSGLALEPEFSPARVHETTAQPHPEGAPQGPEEIHLTPSAGSPDFLEEVEQTPESQEIPLEIQTPTGGAPAPAADSLPAEKTSNEVPAFNYTESREEIAFYVAQGFYEEAQRAVRDIEGKYPHELRVADLRRLADEREQQRAQESQAPPEEEVQTLDDTPGVSVDLAGELSSTLEKIQTPEPAPVAADPPPANSSDGSTQEAFADLSGLLDELQESKGPEVEPDDPETHYNLGVAFREMGLIDEAIGEFQKAVKSGKSENPPPNYLQGCTLLAACFIDKGMPGVAAQWYSQAIEIPGLDQDAILALRYDLGAAYEQAGEYKSALEEYTKVYSQNIDYRDVADKIRILRQRAD